MRLIGYFPVRYISTRQVPQQRKLGWLLSVELKNTQIEHKCTKKISIKMCTVKMQEERRR